MREAWPMFSGWTRASFFAGLEAEAVDCLVVDVRGDLFDLQPAHLVDFQLLFMDIALVFGLDLHLFGDGSGEVGAAEVEGGQLLVAQLRAATRSGPA